MSRGGVGREAPASAPAAFFAFTAFTAFIAFTPLAARAAPPPTPWRVVLLAPADDPRLERAQVERAVPGHALGPAADAVRLALQESRFPLDAAGAAIELQTVDVADAAAAQAAAQAAARAGAAAIVADLPATALLAAADAAPTLPVLNVGAADDALREADCRPNLWHLLPSERMKADALAQALVARRWTRVLLLSGPGAADAARAKTAQAALARYRLNVVAQRPFKLSADPRERELANPRLLTQGDYDVVWVVDSDGEFGVMLPYRTALPRPVVGDAGLVALAWSPKFERYGAPQVSRRLTKAVGRPLDAHDWPAWMAGKVLVAAAIGAPNGTPAALRAQLPTLEVDGSKGVAMSFRPWDGQLRQPVLLTDAQAVIELAPGDGVLHPRNRLDALGADAPEKLCRRR
jgi:ABC transporter substrate binding protein (PQQ-dependent alcohol dehydrogenase system)